MNHTRKIHPSSTTALSLSRKKALKKSKGKSGQLNNSSIIIKTLNARHCSAKLSCSQCDYRTDIPHRMKRHKVLHQKRSDQECSLRSYSANRKRDDYSPINKCKDSSIDESPPVPSVTVEEASVIHKCDECEYETTVKKHMKRHRVCHNVKSAHQCPWCSFSARSLTRLTIHVNLYHTKIEKKALVSENQPTPSIQKSTKEWYYFRGGRISYKNCGNCDYKTTDKKRMIAHIKLIHPFSTTAPQPLISKKKNPRFHCAHCPFKTNKKCNFEQHVAHHRDHPGEYQCHLCSFSGSNRCSLTVHLKLHYREMDENNNNMGEQLDVENDIGNNSAAGSSRNSRGSLLSCRDCDLFKTTSRFTLKRHVKRVHPFSLSALPPVYNKRIKSGLKVAQKTHQAVGDALVPAPEGTREEWYVRSSGKKRQRYIYCGDCNYRTTSRYHIIPHAEKMHPSSTTAVPSQPMQTRLLNCLECDFSTSNAGNMKGHKKAHQRDGKFKCSFCSFSSNFRSSISLHFKSGHHQNPKSTCIEEVRSKARLRKQFDIKECRVVLRNILTPSLIKVLNLKDEEEENPADEIQLLKIRLKAMEEKARIAEEEVKEISSKKMNVQKRIDEIERRKVMIEYLRSQPCNLLEMSLSAPNAEVDFDGIFTNPVEEKVNCLEAEMKLIEGQLGALKEEEKSLTEDLEYAQESHFGVVQVIESLQSELDGYLLKHSV